VPVNRIGILNAMILYAKFAWIWTKVLHRHSPVIVTTREQLGEHAVSELRKVKIAKTVLFMIMHIIMAEVAFCEVQTRVYLIT
jgi:hypothetical protein